MLYSFSNFHTREEIIHWIISLILNIFLNCGFIELYCTQIITVRPEMPIPNLSFRLACLSNIMSALLPFKYPMILETLILGGILTNICT